MNKIATLLIAVTASAAVSHLITKHVDQTEHNRKLAAELSCAEDSPWINGYLKGWDTAASHANATFEVHNLTHCNLPLTKDDPLI